MSRLISTAARAWPTEYRREHGDELIATATELCDDRSTTREATSLALAGLRARYRATTGASTIGTWAAAARIALLITVATVVAEVQVAMQIGPVGGFTAADLNQLALSAFLVVGLVGLALALLPVRLTAAIATVAAAISWFWGPIMPASQLSLYIGTHLALIWFLAWRNERHDAWMAARMLALIATITAVALAIGSFWLAGDAVLAILTLVGVALAGWDPRLLAGMCLYWGIRLVIMMPILVQGEAWAPHQLWFQGLILACTMAGLVRVQRSLGREAAI